MKLRGKPCRLGIIFWMAAYLSGCSSELTSEEAFDHRLDAKLRLLIATEKIPNQPVIPSSIPDIESPMAQLGKQLFFSTALSGNFDVACVSCHHPRLGGGDDLAVSIGVEAVLPELLGPSRQHENAEFNIPRNSPTIFNIALWQKSLFWDSRVEVLYSNDTSEKLLRTPESRFGSPDSRAMEEIVATQSFFPIISTDEMRGEHFQFGMANDAVRLHLAARLGNYGIGENEITPNPWPERFSKVFNQTGSTADSYKITFQDIALALAAYQRSQVFVDNPWSDYVAGDDTAIPTAAKRGALLFYQSIEQGGAGCSSCHSGAFFSDEQHYALGSPQIGIGKNNGPNQDDDFGRARETRDMIDKYKFRTPTLLNVAETQPYFHVGSAKTLHDAIEQHIQPAEYAKDYFAHTRWCEISPFKEHPDCVNLFPNAEANTQLALKAISNRPVTPELTEHQMSDLVVFLNQLTDPCVTNMDCLAPWVMMPQQSDHQTLQPVFAND